MMHASTAPLAPLFSLLVVLPLLAFWVWMLRDMLNNDHLPTLVTRDARSDWLLGFIFLNVFAAALYYSLVYRQRR